MLLGGNISMSEDKLSLINNAEDRTWDYGEWNAETKNYDLKTNEQKGFSWGLAEGTAQFALELYLAKISIESIKESLLSNAKTALFLNALTNDDASQSYEASLNESFNDHSGIGLKNNKFSQSNVGNETLDKFVTEVSGWNSYQWGKNVGYFGSSVAFSYGVSKAWSRSK